MKNKNNKSKLTLNKVTISKLNDYELTEVNGGSVSVTVTVSVSWSWSWTFAKKMQQ